MKLAYWMYSGPAHIGTLRVASSFKNVHAIMHAPLGDDYFNVMRSMLQRERDFTPVTASIVDRHVLARGSQNKVVETITRKDKEERPDLILLTPTCTSSILQEDLQNFVARAALESKSDVLLADVNHYRVNELQAADRTLEQVVRFYLEKNKKALTTQSTNQRESSFKSFKSKEEVVDTVTCSSGMQSFVPPDTCFSSSLPCKTEGDDGHSEIEDLYDVKHDAHHEQNIFYDKNKQGFLKTKKPSANIIGIFTLGFHNSHDCRELKKLLSDLGIDVNLVIPEGGSVTDLHLLPRAWFNIVPYREVGLMTAAYLEKEFDMPVISTTPMGVVDTALFIRQIADALNKVSLKVEDRNFCLSLSDRDTKSLTSKQEAALLPLLEKENELDLLLEKGHVLREAYPVHNALSVQSASQNKAESNLNPLEINTQSKQIVKAPKERANQKFNFDSYIDSQTRFVSQAAWFSRSIDCQNLTGKRSVVFGDSTHAASMTRILAREMGVRVCCAGTYCKHDADWFREQVQGFCDEVLITDDHTQVGDMIARIEPATIFGTQMERHIGKRLDIPCGVISSPVHIQNFSLGYRPFLGYEGSNQIADLVYNSFTLGMEDHLLEIFGGHDTKEVISKSLSASPDSSGVTWAPDGVAELKKIPGFVRGKVKRNTERFALENSFSVITLEVMYAAKEAAGA